MLDFIIVIVDLMQIVDLMFVFWASACALRR